MARLAGEGHWYPTVVTAIIALVLAVWALYALSGAGVVRPLPFSRLVLCSITGIYLLRGIAFAPLMPMFPENGISFWITTSVISLGIGGVHLVGLREVWAQL